MTTQPSIPAHYCPACRTTTPAPEATAEALVQAGVDHRAECPGPADLRQRIADALSEAGAFCGECGFEPGETGCPDCVRVREVYTDALLATVQPEFDQRDRHIAELQDKLCSFDDNGKCCCSFDGPGDVCAVHSPTVKQLRAELDRTRAELAAVRAQVSVVLGYTYMEINDSMDPSQHDYAEAYNDGLEAAKRAAITAAPTT